MTDKPCRRDHCGRRNRGLTAAEALCEAGLRVIVIEARDRIGGRIFTKHDPEAGFPSSWAGIRSRAAADPS